MFSSLREEPFFTDEYFRTSEKVGDHYRFYTNPENPDDGLVIIFSDESWKLADNTDPNRVLISRGGNTEIPHDYGTWDYVVQGEVETYPQRV